MGDEKGKIAALFLHSLKRICVMFSLVLLEASLPHLALTTFSPETKEFNTLISGNSLAVCEV